MTTSPFTLTRPAAMSSSECRRGRHARAREHLLEPLRAVPAGSLSRSRRHPRARPRPSGVPLAGDHVQPLGDGALGQRVRGELLERRQLAQVLQPELLEEGPRGTVQDGVAVRASRPTSLTSCFSTSELMTPSEFTPRTALTPWRVTGCWYAMTASASSAACERRRVSQDSTSASTASWYAGWVYSFQPPATSRSWKPRSSAAYSSRSDASGGRPPAPVPPATWRCDRRRAGRRTRTAAPRQLRAGFRASDLALRAMFCTCSSDYVLLARELRGAVEALLFVSDDPLSAGRIATLLSRTAGEIAAVLTGLRDEYAAGDRGFQLREVAGGWKLYTHPAHHAVVEELVLSWDTRRLSQAALEALAVIAYQQPVTRQGVNAIRGVNSEGVISSLVEKQLVRDVGRDPQQGNAILYGTTRAFLERFGLKDLGELPPLEEFTPDANTERAIQERLHAVSRDEGAGDEGDEPEDVEEVD